MYTHTNIFISFYKVSAICDDKLLKLININQIKQFGWRIYIYCILLNYSFTLIYRERRNVIFYFNYTSDAQSHQCWCHNPKNQQSEPKSAQTPTHTARPVQPLHPQRPARLLTRPSVAHGQLRGTDRCIYCKFTKIWLVYGSPLSCIIIYQATVIPKLRPTVRA